ncbi:MAG: hypothetical protein WA317_11045 [Mycobacterium sp.]
MGYDQVPFGAMPGFGHVGLGGSLGWADPASGLAFAFVHNRLLSPFVVTRSGRLRRDRHHAAAGAAAARAHGFQRVSEFGLPFPATGAVAG